MAISDIRGDGYPFSAEDNPIDNLYYQQHGPNQPKTPTMTDIFSRLLIPESPIPDQKEEEEEEAKPIAQVDGVDQKLSQTNPTYNDAKSSLPQQETGSVKQMVNEPALPQPPPPAGGAPPPAPGVSPPAPASPPKAPAPAPAVPAPAPKGAHDTKSNPAAPSIQTSAPLPPTRQQERPPPSEQMPNIPPGGPPPRPQPHHPPAGGAAAAAAKDQAAQASKPSLSPGSDLGSLGRIGVFGEDSFAVHNAARVPLIHVLLLCLVSIWFIMALKRT